MDAAAPAIKPAAMPAPAEPLSHSRRKTLRERLLLAILLLILGGISTLAISWLLAFDTELEDDPALTGQGFDGVHVEVSGWSGFGSIRLHSTRSMPNWSVLQATGPPDTPGAGDIVTAWASRTTDAQKEWVILDYATAVVPKQIDVHETHNPGALEKVSVFDDQGAEVVVWQGIDPTPVGAGRGVSSIPARVKFKTSRVKIYIDSPRVAGWNEIDTVGLHDTAGNTHWPVAASASTSYGASPTPPAGPSGLAFIPDWCPIGKLRQETRSARPNNEQRVFEARGWPMLAMWGERDLTAGNVVSATTGGGPGGGGMQMSPIFTGSSGIPGTTGATPRRTGLTIPASATASTPLSPMLPLRPIWRGFVINTFIMAILLRLIYLALAVPRRFVLELARMRRGCCLRCGYQLGFDFRAGCPECGWRRGSHD